MTQKRFVYYEHKGADYILDTPNKSLDFIEMLGDCLEAEEIVDLLNELHDENEQLRKENDMFSCELSVSANKEISRNCRIAELEEENKQYKSLFFELVETALTDKNCRELYCKGILDIFNKANSLNQAREMIKEYLE